ncbi:MAG: NHL repeat-containing protein [Candidatus Acidiferrales bacterium]
MPTLTRPARLLPILICLCVAQLCAGCGRGAGIVEAQAARQPLEYLGAWGAKGTDPGQIDDPSSIATNANGAVFLADAGSAYIQKFRLDGTPLLAFQEDALRHPQCITVDSGGAIYVSDPQRSSVFIFLPDGDRYREVRVRTRSSQNNLLSVAVGADGLINVLDSNAGKVFTFTSRARLVRSWQVPGAQPGANGPGPIAVGPDGSLYIAEPAANRIERFSPEGRALGEIGFGANTGAGKLSRGFAVSFNGVFVMDEDGRMLHVFSIQGQLEHNFDLAPQLGQGTRPPPALAAGDHNELLVLDAPGARVLRYRTNF